MRKIVLALLAAGGIDLFTPQASAAPVAGAAIGHAVAPTVAEQVCLSITGEFLYPGPCRPYVVRPYHPYRWWGWHPRHHHHYH